MIVALAAFSKAFTCLCVCVISSGYLASSNHGTPTCFIWPGFPCPAVCPASRRSQICKFLSLSLYYYILQLTHIYIIYIYIGLSVVFHFQLERARADALYNPNKCAHLAFVFHISYYSMQWKSFTQSSLEMFALPSPLPLAPSTHFVIFLVFVVDFTTFGFGQI